MEKYIVKEGNTTILRTNDKQEALTAMREAHRKNVSEYHEVHEFNCLNDNLYHGTNQLEPYDCPTCFRNPRDCVCKVKVKTPEGWMTHAEWSNQQTLETFKEMRQQGKLQG